MIQGGMSWALLIRPRRWTSFLGYRRIKTPQQEALYGQTQRVWMGRWAAASPLTLCCVDGPATGLPLPLARPSSTGTDVLSRPLMRTPGAGRAGSRLPEQPCISPSDSGGAQLAWAPGVPPPAPSWVIILPTMLGHIEKLLGVKSCAVQGLEDTGSTGLCLLSALVLVCSVRSWPLLRGSFLSASTSNWNTVQASLLLGLAQKLSSLWGQTVEFPFPSKWDMRPGRWGSYGRCPGAALRAQRRARQTDGVSPSRNKRLSGRQVSTVFTKWTSPVTCFQTGSCVTKVIKYLRDPHDPQILPGMKSPWPLMLMVSPRILQRSFHAREV